VQTKAGTYLVWLGHNPLLFISDVKVIQELYTTQNKIFDKHPLVRDTTMCITGRSILFADTDEKWSQRRKALSPAFYKGKLISMINLAK
jgi:cytochrome P450